MSHLTTSREKTMSHLTTDTLKSMLRHAMEMAAISGRSDAIDKHVNEICDELRSRVTK